MLAIVWVQTPCTVPTPPASILFSDDERFRWSPIRKGTWSIFVFHCLIFHSTRVLPIPSFFAADEKILFLLRTIVLSCIFSIFSDELLRWFHILAFVSSAVISLMNMLHLWHSNYGREKERVAKIINEEIFKNPCMYITIFCALQYLHIPHKHLRTEQLQ